MPIVHSRVRHRPALLPHRQGNRTLSHEVEIAVVAEAAGRIGDNDPRK
jgi:hypothetical protein